MKITISTAVSAPIEKVWAAWTTPESITQWNFATNDWICPKAENDLKVGKKFCYRMEAKDGSMGFDFEGKYTQIEKHKVVKFDLDDQRKIEVTFEEVDQGILVSESFEAEDENSAKQQKQGWQCILDNFKKHVEETKA